MVLSLCLFACAPETETRQIARASVISASITLTDTETADEATRQTAFDNAVQNVRIRIFFTDDSSPMEVLGDGLEFDTSAVSWGTVGVYYATITPKATEEYTNDNNVSLVDALEVRIDHSFGEPDENGEAVCACGATKTVTSLPSGSYETLKIGGFHGAPTNDTSKGDLKQIKPFGTTESGDVVNSFTAGTIRKGSSIVIEGSVQSSGSDNVWYYPNLGIALREYTEESPFLSSSDYNGEQGMSVIVRNDGWVLMNGIGNSPRLLAALAGGQSEAVNYGSHTGAGKPTVTLPFDYDPANMPADTSTWGDWAVYSSGTKATSGDYSETQNIRITYSFRADNVIEITNENTTKNVSLIARIKVPAAYENVSFDTVLHGENVTYRLTSVTTIEQEKLESVTFNGFDSDAKVNYVAGEAINLADFDGRLQIKYVNNDVLVEPDSFELQAFRGELAEGATEPAEDAAGWTTLDENTGLLATDTFFRIAVTVGNTTAYDPVKLGDEGFLQKIAPNSVSDVYGYAIEYNGAVYDSTAYASIGFAADATADNVAISPVGIATRSDVIEGCDGYLALRIYGSGFGTAQADANAIIVAQAEDYIDVIVGVGAADKVTITGAQTTPIVIDLAGVQLPGYTLNSAAIAVEGYTGALTTIPVNTGAEVTLTYAIDADAAEEILFGTSTVTRNMGTVADFVAGEVARFAYAYDATYEDGVFTLTFTVPAAPTAAEAVTIYINDPTTGVTSSEVFYYGAPVAAEDNGDVITLDNGYSAYITADSSNIYYYVLLEKETLTEADIKLGDLWLNVNGGAMANLGNINLGFTYANGAVATSSSSVVGAAGVFGTTDDANDIDHGFLFVGRIAVSGFGIATGAEEWYFQIMADPAEDAQSGIYKVTVGEKVVTVTDVPDSTEEPSVLVEATCTTDGVFGNAIRNADGDIVFIYNATIIPGEHVYAEDAEYKGIEGYTYSEGECTRCGKVYGWKVEGVEVGKTDNSVAYGVTNEKNAAYNPGVGEQYSVVYKGQTVVANGTATSSRAGVWSGFTALLYKADIFFATTNLRIDNYMNYAAGQSGTINEYGFAFTSRVTSTVTIDQAQEAMNAAGGAPASIVWDWSDASQIVVTMSVTTVYGDYVCEYTFKPASGDEFEENWYSIGIAPDGGSFTGTITASGSEATNFNMAKEHRDLPIEYDKDGAFEIGTEGNGTGWSAKEHTLPINKGEKLVMSGPMTSAGVSQWQAPSVGIYSGASAVGMMRPDNYVLENNYASISIAVAAQPSRTDWEQVSKILANCTATYTIDFSDESKIVVTMQYVSEEEGTFTMTYTLTSTSGALADKYSIDFSCDNCYVNFENFERIAAHEHVYSTTTDRCEICDNLNPNHGNVEAGGLAHNYVDGVCTICGQLDSAHEHSYSTEPGEGYGYCVCGELDPNHGTDAGTPHIDTDENGICDACDELMPDHVHSYSTTPGEGYGYCVCGQFDPNHGTDAGTPHIDENEDGICDACEAAMAGHQHVYVNYICTACKAVDTASLDALATTSHAVTNNDTSEDWWNGNTADIATVSGDFVVKMTFTNTKANPGTVLELQIGADYFDFNIADSAAGWTAGDMWGTLAGTVTNANFYEVGTRPADGSWNGEFTVYLWRDGAEFHVYYTFTPAGGDAVTYAVLYTKTDFNTGEAIYRVVGNPANQTFTVVTGTIPDTTAAGQDE